MHRKSLPYLDTYAAPGSQLHEALTLGETSKAKRIYEQCEQDARDLLKPKVKPNENA